MSARMTPEASSGLRFAIKSSSTVASSIRERRNTQSYARGARRGLRRRESTEKRWMRRCANARGVEREPNLSRRLGCLIRTRTRRTSARDASARCKMRCARVMHTSPRSIGKSMSGEREKGDGLKRMSVGRGTSTNAFDGRWRKSARSWKKSVRQ